MGPKLLPNPTGGGYSPFYGFWVGQAKSKKGPSGQILLGGGIQSSFFFCGLDQAKSKKSRGAGGILLSFLGGWTRKIKEIIFFGVPQIARYEPSGSPKEDPNLRPDGFWSNPGGFESQKCLPSRFESSRRHLPQALQEEPGTRPSGFGEE